MSFISTKFHKILLSGFSGADKLFQFGQISKYKKGRNSDIKNWIKISCGNSHLHMSCITTKFHFF